MIIGALGKAATIVVGAGVDDDVATSMPTQPRAWHPENFLEAKARSEESRRRKEVAGASAYAQIREKFRHSGRCLLQTGNRLLESGIRRTSVGRSPRTCDFENAGWGAMNKSTIALPLAVFFLSCLFAIPARGQTAEPGWDWRVIGSRDFREQIQSTPIELRPYRPFHFYGNTVRREYYRGTPMPAPRGWAVVPGNAVPLTPRGATRYSSPFSRR
jgi:hypothetical protein